MKRMLRIALAGNPNSGKTSIFNAMTGARQHVGNYPGVTVEKKEGTVFLDGETIQVIDLPGTYSLTAFSIEEIVARNFIVEEKPDVVINIVDGSNLERNLYLTVQLLELRIPMVVAVNMADELERKGIRLDMAAFERCLGCPVRPTVGHRGTGVEDLLRAAVKCAEGQAPNTGEVPLHLGDDIDGEIRKVAGQIQLAFPDRKRPPSSWVALKLIENDSEVLAQYSRLPGMEKAMEQTERSIRHLKALFGDEPEMVVAEKRYGIISGIQHAVVRTTPLNTVALSDKIDKVLTNRITGLPIFAIFMYLTFWLVFTVGGPPMEWIDAAFGWLGGAIDHLWPRDSDSLLRSLLVDGVIGGVGGVIVFLPNILMLFLAIGVLEYSGYMARAAFIMDRVMKWSGFHGKSFIPMLTGFGCSVPAIMGTRCLDNQRDRLVTILVLPLMSCGARFPIYALIIPAFFPPAQRAPILYGIYMTGIILAIVLAKLLRSTFFRGDLSPFVMELPPYRIPTMKAILIYMWERSRLYLRKAGTIILTVSIILWALGRFPAKAHFDQDYPSLAAQARQAYLHSVASLDTTLKTAAARPVMLPFAEIQLRFEELSARYWESELPYQEALKERDRRTAELRARSPELAAFLDARASADAPAAGPGQPAKVPADAQTLHTLDLFKAAKQTYVDRLAALENQKAQEQLRHSAVGRIGSVLEKVLSPAGFNWKLCSALVGALAAKEVFVSQLSIIYSLGQVDPGDYEDVSHGGDTSLGAALKADVYPLGERRAGKKVVPPLVALCILLFCLVSAPCMATIAVTVRETNSWKWGLLQLGGLSALAWVLTVAFYQIGSRLGIGVG